MKKSIMLFSVLASLSLPAAADESWPRNPVPGADNNGGVSATKAPAATYNVWTDAIVPYGSSAAATGADKGGQHPLTAAELSAQLAINKAYQHETREAIIAAGGCNADILPVWVHQACNRSIFANADGGDGSSGGGDSGSDAK